jgi:FkbM family methyltransferase
LCRRKNNGSVDMIFYNFLFGEIYFSQYIMREMYMKNKMGIITFFMVMQCLAQQHPAAIRTMGSLRIYEDSVSSDAIGYDNCNMMTNGEFAVMINLIKPQDTVFDVGANKGEWSLYALSVAKSLKLYAFEPISEIYQQLKNNVSIHEVFLNNCAISRMKGTKEFFCYNRTSEAMACSTFYRRDEDVERRFVGKPEVIKVNVETLDSFCLDHDIQHIHFVKIDTEGSELDVLYGARALLTDQKIDVIQLEYGGTYRDAGITLKQVFNFLTVSEYKLFRIAFDGLVPVSTWRDSLETYRYANYLAISSSAAKMLSSC